MRVRLVAVDLGIGCSVELDYVCETCCCGLGNWMFSRDSLSMYGSLLLLWLRELMPLV